MRKDMLRESIWLTAFIAVTFLLDFLLFGQSSLLRNVVELQLHDTYFVLRSQDWLATVFVLIVLPVYLTKEGRRKYSRFLPNIMLAFLLLVVLFVLFFWHRFLFQVSSTGWVVYPPFSSNPDLLEEIIQSYSKLGNTIFFFFELSVTVSLFMLGIRTGVIRDKEGVRN